MKSDRSKKFSRARLLRRIRTVVGRPKWRKSRAVRWSLGVGLTVAIAGLFPSARTTALSGFSAGSLWTNSDVSAPFTFPVYRDGVRYQQDVRSALAELRPVYVADTSADKASVELFQNHWNGLLGLLQGARNDSLNPIVLADSARAFGVSKDAWNALSSRAQSESGKEFERNQHELEGLGAFLLKQIDDIESMRFLVTAESLNSNEEAQFKSNATIAVRSRPTEESWYPRDSLVAIEAAANRIFAKVEPRVHSDEALQPVISSLLSGSILPNIIFSSTLTEETRQNIIDRVPRTDGIVVEGQNIVEKGDILTPKIVSELESLSKARLERGGTVAELLRIAGTMGHAGLIVLLLVLYLKFIRRKIYNDNAQILLMSLVMLFPAIMAYFSVRIPVDFPLQYFILIPAASMLLTVLFDSRTGFYGTVAVSLIVAGIRGNDYSVALAGLCAGAFAAYTVRDLRNRAQLFASIGYVFIGYCVAVGALSLEQGTPLREALYELISSLGNALISPVITLGLLYVIELLFDTTSDLRLTEFETINHPLLQELALRAPGTYQHTMLVAQLAEHAASAIGANPLLAKIGAYYHDVGKLSDPPVFVENQSGTGNIHAKLSAWESAERVKNHIAQGIQLARAHGLPQRVIDFIPMHHGTLPISFFYQRAVIEAAGNGSVDESEFRYSGPIPNSKETAIVMLADAAEAIARSLAQRGEEMSYEMIDTAIEQLIRTRFDQGQFDQSDITVRDFLVVRSVFARHLSGLHHPRVPYPEPKVAQSELTLAPV